MNSVEEICDEASINKSKKILDGKIHDLKNKYTNNKWTIIYIGNKMSFTNAVWGGWKLENHDSINEKTHVATIELLDQLKISDFVKGIVNHVEIQEAKNSPSMQDVFQMLLRMGEIWLIINEYWTRVRKKLYHYEF